MGEQMDDKKNMWQFLKTEGKGVLVLFLFVFGIAILLLILSVNIEATYPKTAKVSQLIAGILGVSGTINILLRASFWKDTVEDVLLSLSNNFEGRLSVGLSLGLEEVVWFGEYIPWKKWLAETTKFEVFAIRAGTLFTGASQAQIQTFLQRPKTRLVVVFSDFREDDLMNFYDTSFGEEKGTRARKIQESIKHVYEIATNAKAEKRITIRLAKKPFHYALYRFDQKKVLFTPTWSKPGKESGRIPGFMFERDKSMYDMALKHEIAYLLSNEGSSPYKRKDEKKEIEKIDEEASEIASEKTIKIENEVETS